MFSIRTSKTASGATAVQVIRYQNRKTIVVKHIGSAHTQEEGTQLKQAASDWIQEKTRQISLFSERKQSNILLIDKSEYLGIHYTFFAQIIRSLFDKFSFREINSNLLLDLTLIRILEPASKLRSLQLLQEYFGISYSRSALYRQMPLWLGFKDEIEAKVISIAKGYFSFNFKLVFYDVTTLYFESFTADDLRRLGFSKDFRFNQPQILIGLLVDSNGFPVSYDIFAGNTFEGHTLLPTIVKLKEKHRIDNLTIVADAAMLSMDNILKLTSQNLDYIVGARVGNMSRKLIDKISFKISGKNGKTIRVKTDYGFLICDFSRKRYNKDKHDMDKQMKQATEMIKKPGKLIKRYKFVCQKRGKVGLNQSLIKKSKLLLGIKGYYTNLSTADEEVIKHYRQLWQVEKSFRIAKSDLHIRPVYHWRKEAIQAHILLCFMALSIIKYMEITTGKSSQEVVRLLKSVTDAQILNKLTNEKIIMRSKVTDEVKKTVKLMGVSY